MIDIRVDISGDAERAVAKLLRTDLMPDLRTGMNEATAPMVKEVKESIRSIPSTRKRTSAAKGSLRSAIANTVTRKTRLSSRKVMIVIKQVPRGGKSNLGTVLEGVKPWEHKTYGHDPTVTQESHPAFYPAIHRLEGFATRHALAVINRLERRL